MDAIQVVASLPRHATTGAPSLWQPSDVHVDLHPTHCRRPNAAVDAAIDAEWAARRRAHPNVELFNALKFRLAGLHVAQSDARCASPTSGFDAGKCASAGSPPALTLRIGLTDYKSNVATNATVASGHDHESASWAHVPAATFDRADVSDAIGVEALVLSSDDHVLFFRRSHRVAECPGYFCGPGGHAEPFRVVAALREQRASHCSSTPQHPPTPGNSSSAGGHPAPSLLFDAACERISDAAPAGEVAAWCREWCAAPHGGIGGPATASDVPVKTEASEPSPVAIAERLVADELFFSAREEVADELGVPLDVVEMCGLAGIVRVPRHNLKPIAVFVVRLRDVTAAAATAAFERRRGEACAFEADSAAPFLALPLAKAAAVMQQHDGHVETEGNTLVPITPGTVGCLCLGLPISSGCPAPICSQG